MSDNEKPASYPYPYKQMQHRIEKKGWTHWQKFINAVTCRLVATSFGWKVNEIFALPSIPPRKSQSLVFLDEVQVLMATCMNMTAFWDVVPGSLVDND
jgi:hypothetical protein